MYIPPLSLLYLYRHSVTLSCVTHDSFTAAELPSQWAHGATSHCNFLLLLLTAAQFLHDNGVLLHYNDHLRGLNNLYFIDPAWLCDMLAEVITVPEKNAFARNGILADANVAFLFKDTRKFPPQYLNQYLQLLERFEIALSLGDGTRLIPSMLSVSPPACNFSSPLPMQPGERGDTPSTSIYTYIPYVSVTLPPFTSHSTHPTPHTPSLTPPLISHPTQMRSSKAPLAHGLHQEEVLNGLHPKWLLEPAHHSDHDQLQQDRSGQ